MKLTDHISKYCTYGEAIHSQAAERLNIPNIPDSIQLEAMNYVANEIFDPVREFLGESLFVSSFFRSPQVNLAVAGSSKTSQHMRGEAIDMYKPGRHKEIFDFIRAHLEWDQLIWEYGDKVEPAWVHCSKVSYRPNRHAVLRCYHDNDGNVRYVPFDLYP